MSAPNENRERLRELLKKALADAPPRPHDVRTREHYEQCVECREWSRAVDASFAKVEREEGMVQGQLGALIFVARATKANALAGPRPHSHSESLQELKQCPECQEWERAQAAAWEKVWGVPAEELLNGELAFDPECFTKMKAAMLPAMEVLKKALESGELPLSPGEHRQTHKSQEELLACDVCRGWEKRRDAILEKALGPRRLQR
jgi:hypothetical protein